MFFAKEPSCMDLIQCKLKLRSTTGSDRPIHFFLPHLRVSSIDLISRISTLPKLNWLLLLPLVAFALTFINALFPRLYTGAWSQCNHTHFVYLFGVFETTGCQQSSVFFFSIIQTTFMIIAMIMIK